MLGNLGAGSIFILLTLNSVILWRPFKFVFTNIQITQNRSIIEMHGNISMDSKNTTYINVRFKTKETFQRPLMSKDVLLKQVKGGTYRTFINTTVNNCDAIKIAKLTPFLSGLYKEIVSHMHPMFTCPFVKGSYTVHKVGGIEDEFPQYLPMGSFRLILRFYLDFLRYKTFIGTLNIDLMVAPNTAKKPKGSKVGKNKFYLQ